MPALVPPSVPQILALWHVLDSIKRNRRTLGNALLRVRPTSLASINPVTGATDAEVHSLDPSLVQAIANAATSAPDAPKVERVP